ncbi:MAG: SDR family NAD(P)-dependent oxidoreductase, partial [Chloroflexota bacterium]
MRLDGKVALITGAGSGMGRVAALLFAREGARVVGTDVDETAGQETASLARAEGLDVRFFRADVSREADCRAMVAFAEETFGKLDVLYNNAGIFPEADHSVTDTEEAVWDRVLAVNVKGVYLA